MVEQLLNFIIRCYGVFVCVWFLANVFVQDAWWPLVVLDKFAEYFLVLCIPFFLLALITKKRSTLIAAFLAVLVSGYFYVPLLFPAGPQSVAFTTPKVQVGTYNIWNHNTDLETVVALVNSTNADIIAIQEITDVQQAEFTERMSATYPYYHVSQQVYGGTTGLFSKRELSNIQELDFGIDRPAIIADASVDGGVITVASAHLNPSFWAYHNKPLLEIPGNYHGYIKDQNTQARMIVEAVKERTNSIASVLACDCNSQETASTNKLLATYFKDAFRAIGYQFGKPSEASLKYERKLSHIDYIWYSGFLTPRAVYRARRTAGSDHAPVMADFYINN